MKMALQKMLLKKRLKYWDPLPPNISYCDKTIGSRELIFGTIHIKKCMNNLEYFQQNLRWSSGEFSLNCHVWRGMTHPVANLKVIVLQHLQPLSRLPVQLF